MSIINAPKIMPCLHVLFEQVLYKTVRLKVEPIEWVYDGLKPLFYSDVLTSLKTIPLSNAMVVASVARRLGVPVRLVCAHDSQQPGTGLGE